MGSNEPRAAASDRAQYVRSMFGAIARRYDFLNHLLSAGLDKRWRRRAAEACARCLAAGDAAAPHQLPAYAPRASGAAPVVLDSCCGTADLALAVLARMPQSRVIACDFSRPMLERAARKFARAGLAGRAETVEADALALPFPDGSVDAATCAFGLRNLADPARGLAEMVRVVRPGGPVVILEFHQPRGRSQEEWRGGSQEELRGGSPCPPRSVQGAAGAETRRAPSPLAARAFGLYFHGILPRLGAWISGGDRGGYRYLVDSIEAFGPPEALLEALAQAGLQDVTIEPLTGGIASVYAGRKCTHALR